MSTPHDHPTNIGQAAVFQAIATLDRERLVFLMEALAASAAIDAAEHLGSSPGSPPGQPLHPPSPATASSVSGARCSCSPPLRALASAT